jgi:hypothetical protein
VNKNQERRCRQALRADIAGSSYWSDLVPTVDLVPAFLLEAWADLCNGFDDDAMVAWSGLLDETYQPRCLRYITTAADLVQEYISLVTCGHTRAEIAWAASL